MRNLTIKRTKSFVASLAGMRVFIEDIAGHTVIENVTCRKLGTLKNGEEKSFLIDEREAKVFVIADSLSKGFCNDYYQIPAGDEDISLSGKNLFNPATGNAFRFDNNNSADVAASRRKGENKGVVVLIVSLIIGAILGMGISNGIIRSLDSRPKDFSEQEMTVTLTREFGEFAAEGFTVSYSSEDVVVFALREDFSLAEGLGDFTLDDYAALVMYNNGIEGAELKNVDGIPYFEYDTDFEDETYSYAIFVYKASDAFWLFQFATHDEDYDKLKLDILGWASSVRFE